MGGGGTSVLTTIFPERTSLLYSTLIAQPKSCTTYHTTTCYRRKATKPRCPESRCIVSSFRHPYLKAIGDRDAGFAKCLRVNGNRESHALQHAPSHRTRSQ